MRATSRAIFQYLRCGLLIVGGGLGVACRDYTCADTASCPVEPGDAGDQSSGPETTYSSGAGTHAPDATTTDHDTSSCDECSLGDVRCVDGKLTACELTDACWVWSAPKACAQGSCAD